MDNQQPTTPPQTPPQAPQPTPPSIEPQAVFVKKAPMQMIASLFTGLRPKPKTSTPSSIPAQVSPTVKPESPIPVKKIVIIMTIIFVLLMVGFVVFRLITTRREPTVIEATPTPEPTAAAATPPPTRYATDSAVLQIESQLQTLDQELSGVDIDEVNIKPRTLLWNVNFSK